MVTGLRGTHRSPGDAVASTVEAAERPLQAFDIRKQGIFANLDAIHNNLACDRSAERKLLLDLRRGQARLALLEHEAADLAAMRVRLRPNDEHVCDRRIRDPHLGPGEAGPVARLLGARAHAAG